MFLAVLISPEIIILCNQWDGVSNEDEIVWKWNENSMVKILCLEYYQYYFLFF